MAMRLVPLCWACLKAQGVGLPRGYARGHVTCYNNNIRQCEAKTLQSLAFVKGVGVLGMQ